MKILSAVAFAGVCIIALLYLGGCTERGAKEPAYTKTTQGDTVIIANTKQGEELFRQKCMACHGANGAARNNKAVDLSMTILDSLGIVTTIMNGRGTMPGFKNSLPDSDIAQIAVYVKTLRATSPH